MKNKICSKCNIPKSLDNFNKNPKLLYGVQNHCKKCMSEYNKSRYLLPDIKTLHKIKSSIYYENNKENIEFRNLYKEKTVIGYNKKCDRCNLNKSYDNFYKSKTTTDGYSKICSLCHIEKYSIKSPPKKQCKDCKEKIGEHNGFKSGYYRKDGIPLYLNKCKICIKVDRNRRQKTRYDNDPLFKITNTIRSLINISFKIQGYSKSSRTYIILGCTFEEFKLYIESLWEPWMNWGNYGNPKDGLLEFNKNWDIDHIVPISSAKNREDVIKLNHFSNLQPLCSKVNREVKRNKINYERS